MVASWRGWTDVVRELITANGSVEHLRMKDNEGEMALDMADNDEIKALLTAAEAAAGADAAAPPPEGKAREGEEENQEEDSPPPQTQGGAQPKKTLPRPVYEGDADALVEVLAEARREGEEPDIAKVRELLDAGIDVRYQVRARYKRIMRNAKRRDKRGLKLTTTALSLASQYGQTDVVRELIAADGSMEHLRMKNKHGKTARDLAKTDEIKALLTAAEAAESS